MFDSSNLFESEPLRSLPQELIRSLPSQKSDFMLSNDFEPFVTLEQDPDLSYQLTRLKSAKIYFSGVEKVDIICNLLRAHGDSFDEKIELLRDMHQNLTLKRRVLAALEAEHSAVLSPKSSTHKAFAGHVLFFLKNLLRVISCSFRFIYPAINRPVQAHFGSGVVTVFIYCWWFFCINIFNLIWLLLFLAIPQHVFNEGFQIGGTREPFSLFYIINGTGWFTNSTFFYSGYTNETFEISPGIFYNMPLVYVLVISMIFLVNFFIIVYSFMTYCAEQQVFNSSGNYPFSKVVFSHYDYAMGLQAVINYMKSSFYEEVQVLMNQKRQNISPLGLLKMQQIVLFFLVNVGVYLLIFGSCALILNMLSVNYLSDYYPFVVSLMLTIMPNIYYYFLKYVEIFESYFPPKTIFYISIVRLLTLRITLTGLFLYFRLHVFKPEPNTCYQTELSASFFRIVLGNFCVQLFFYSFVAEYLRRKLVDTFGFSFGKSNFDLAYHTVDILYSQFLGWTGLLFVPLIPLLISVHLYLLLFLKANSILDNCHPTKNIWTSSETDNFILKLTLMSFVFSIVFSSYSLLEMEDSNCGPLRVRASKNALLQRVLVWKPDNWPYLSFSEYGLSPILLVIVTMLIGYVVARMRSYAHSMISLKEQLEKELKLNVSNNSILLHDLNMVLKERSEEQIEETKHSS